MAKVVPELQKVVQEGGVCLPCPFPKLSKSLRKIIIFYYFATNYNLLCLF